VVVFEFKRTTVPRRCRAVAQVSRNKGPGQARVVYEDDERTHKVLELGMFQAMDLRDATTRLVVAFVQNAGDVPGSVVGLI
jgi:hypothetical protein